MKKIIGLTLPTLDDVQIKSSTLPYGIALLSALIKFKNPLTETFYSDDVSELLQADEVWCSGLSESWNLVNSLGQIITSHGKNFIVGGHHATALPQSLCYGEVSIGPYELDTLLNVKLAPDWDIFESRKISQGVIMTGFGCPFKCVYCSSTSFWKKYYPKSPEEVIFEIKHLHKNGFTDIFIFDDLFTVNEKRLSTIVDMICAEGLNKCNYTCLVRTDTINNKTIKLLQLMNVTGVGFGIESGSNMILQAMNKGNTVEQNQRGLDLLHSEGMHIGTGCVAGFPGESLVSLQATQDFIEKNRKKAYFEIYPCVPFPGTPLWKHFTQHYDIDIMNFDWESLKIRPNRTDWDKYYLLSDNCTKNDIEMLCEWNENNL